MSLRIVIFGAGGVGGYFGARLATAGNNVTFVARGAHLDAIRKHGLRILSPLGDLEIATVNAVENVAHVVEADFVLLAVKLWDTEAAAPQLSSLAQRGAAVISLQNGVQKEQLLLKHLPSRSVMGGVSYISAAIEEPGVIRHFGPIQNLVFGELDGARSRRSMALYAACQEAGVGARISDDIEREIWEKFVFLVGLSATTATIRQPIGPIRTNPRTRSFLLDVMQETVNIGRASGIRLAEDFAESRLAFCDGLPADMLASMYQDLVRGNRLELPWLSGAVVALGQQKGLTTPCNRAVADILELYVRGTGDGGGCVPRSA
jgi:2-dehydropantoate 2-reductase